ncbi:hypothetical protein [Cerasicoccus arenae]|uniref:Uncharacterized protein n=1 Tax=Cerasicoccus arenae TaxID=424488 RepID=A0A8J3DDA1_9BACT|nr:hypothetical protein [Cerasicoccus arenae]MBK1858072.1 hypothetical protein [Cerasicoccus arenae]GHC06903.1 hypothetical protein GCM10007047_24950 [Cerasicoccus arenae]
MTEFQVGDTLAMSFTMTFDSVSSDITDSLSFGFQQNDATSYYAYLLPGDDANSSDVRYRTGGNGRYMASGGTPVTGADAYNTFFISNDFTPPNDTYSVSLTLSKTISGYDSALSIGGSSFVFTDLTFPSAVEELDINRAAFRNGDALGNLAITNLDVTFSTVPEPGDSALLVVLGVLGSVLLIRKKSGTLRISITE